MRIEGETIVLREVGAYWRRGMQGYKPNAQRMVTPELSRDLAGGRQVYKFVRVYNELGDQYVRELTDVTKVESFLGMDMWSFSWKFRGDPPIYAGEGN